MGKEGESRQTGEGNLNINTRTPSIMGLRVRVSLHAEFNTTWGQNHRIPFLPVHTVESHFWHSVG